MYQNFLGYKTNIESKKTKIYMKKLIQVLVLLAFANTTFAQNPSFKTYSKYDFVSGDKVIALEDFSQGNIGDFPARWNTNGGGEIVMIDGQQNRWLKLNGNSTAYPMFVNELPDNFTLEFNMAVNPNENYAGRVFSLIFTPSTEPKKLFTGNLPSRVKLSFTPLKGATGRTSIDMYGADSKQVMTNGVSTNKFCTPQKSMVKVSIWRQKTRLRMYLDEEKIWDVPLIFDPEARYSKFVFTTNNLVANQTFYISGFRLAVGEPDTRNKLMSEGKFVTTGILFDSNSDQIKAESYGTLKDIAQVLQENANVKVRIIGHTDSDGDDAKNLDLSKRRAAAVKANLSTEFGIDSNRLQADGKGESQPATPNTTPEGKANNRRVEFVKI
jgi:OmpA-OmpF porin, OOP family